MIENQIKVLREKKGLSQRQLATLVGTSQQQIQRIETGKQSIRFGLALEVCKALEMPMETVFPQTKKVLTQVQKKGKTVYAVLLDPKLGDERKK